MGCESTDDLLEDTLASWSGRLEGVLGQEVSGRLVVSYHYTIMIIVMVVIMLYLGGQSQGTDWLGKRGPQPGGSWR